MNRRILYTALLSILVAMGISFILDWFFPPEPTLSYEPDKGIEQIEADSKKDSILSNIEVINESSDEDFINFQTDVYEGVFSTKNASLISLKFKDYEDEEGSLLELLEEGKSLYQEDFLFDGILIPRDIFYTFSSDESGVFNFKAQVKVEGNLLTLTKKYHFIENEYLFKVESKAQGHSFDELKDALVFNLALPPHGQGDISTFYTYTNKMKKISKKQEIEGRWAGSTNRYLAWAVIPSSTSVPMSWTKDSASDLSISWSNVLDGKEINSSFYVYLGPKDSKYLSLYNKTQNNYFGLSGLDLQSLRQSGWFSWLENILAWLLGFFYEVIPNWGIAIILLTFMVKVLLYPLSLKAQLSTASLQKVQPELKALQEKYKDDPAKLQQEMQKIYQKYGVNPLGGCLPILIQIPIFIALYGLFNSYLEFRGAVFIPHWITDLSLPESIYSFGFALPFLGWTHLRLLPIIMLATQFLSAKVNASTPQAATMSPSQQKLLFYGMPTIFFFILYNMPSGLLVYWIVNNILTVIQQIYLRKYSA